MPNLPLAEGLTNSDLECVMLDVDNIPVLDIYGADVDGSDLFFGEGLNLKYAQGLVGEEQAHVTLLYGIHPSETYRKDVDGVLRNLKFERVLIDHVGYFELETDDQEYYCVIAHLVPTVELLAANGALRTLDYTSQYEEYKPHVTLVYLKRYADVDEWVARLDHFLKGKVLRVWGLSYGDTAEDSQDPQGL